MKKGKKIKAILAILLGLMLMPIHSIKAIDDKVDDEYCVLLSKSQSTSFVTLKYKCYGIDTNTLGSHNLRVSYNDGISVGNVSVSNNDQTNSTITYKVNYTTESNSGGSFNTSLVTSDRTLLASETIRINGYESEPEIDEPDVPSTPLGNVFIITQGSPVCEIDAGKESEILIPISRLESIDGYKAQVRISLPSQLYFTEIDNIQNIDFETRRNYDVEVPIKVMANQDVPTGVYPITLSIDYEYDGGRQNDEVIYYVKVIGKGEQGNAIVGTPRIIIDSYSFGGSQVVGGTPFTLGMSFKNASKDVDITNLKITIQSSSDSTSGGVFTPTASSNSFFVDTLPKSSTVYESIVLMPRQDAAPKSYGVDVMFEYEAMINGSLESFSSTEKIAIPLIQNDRFEIGEVEFWGQFYVGEYTDINISYVNKGKTTINNLEIKVESEQLQAMEATTYVGNVESGSSDYFNTSVTALTEGDVSGTVTFTYEDANGSLVSIVKEFSGSAFDPWANYEPPVYEEPIIDEPVDEGMPMWQMIAIGVAGVIIAGGGFFFMKKRKAKKLAADLEDDFGE